MIRRDFSLEQHPAGKPFHELQIKGTITRSPVILSVEFRLFDPLRQILIPPRAEIPARKNGLWEGTCFELFLAPHGSKGYWELNLSPAGHWNLYRFSGYRQGMEEEPAFTSLPLMTRITGDRLQLELDLETGTILIPGCSLEAGVGAVLETHEGERSYWALTHCGPAPDFHAPRSFGIKLPDERSRFERNPSDRGRKASPNSPRRWPS